MFTNFPRKVSAKTDPKLSKSYRNGNKEEKFYKSFINPAEKNSFVLNNAY